MTPEQIKLVKDSWAQVVPIKATAAKLFYDRLFEIDPGLKKLFSEDIEEQGKKLMTILGVAVGKLDKLEEVLFPVWQLGRRHNVYGVKDSDYDTVATAFLWTLEQGLGPAFTPAVKDAWVEAYTALAGVMKQGAHSKYGHYKALFEEQEKAAGKSSESGSSDNVVPLRRA